MGHAYTAAEGCDEVVLLGICSSADEHLLESLMTLHVDELAATSAPKRIAPPSATPAAIKPHDKRKGSRTTTNKAAVASRRK